MCWWRRPTCCAGVWAGRRVALLLHQPPPNRHPWRWSPPRRWKGPAQGPGSPRRQSEPWEEPLKWPCPNFPQLRYDAAHALSQVQPPQRLGPLGLPWRLARHPGVACGSKYQLQAGLRAAVQPAWLEWSFAPAASFAVAFSGRGRIGGLRDREKGNLEQSNSQVAVQRPRYPPTAPKMPASRWRS